MKRERKKEKSMLLGVMTGASVPRSSPRLLLNPYNPLCVAAFVKQAVSADSSAKHWKGWQIGMFSSHCAKSVVIGSFSDVFRDVLLTGHGIVLSEKHHSQISCTHYALALCHATMRK